MASRKRPGWVGENFYSDTRQFITLADLCAYFTKSYAEMKRHVRRAGVELRVERYRRCGLPVYEPFTDDEVRLVMLAVYAASGAHPKRAKGAVVAKGARRTRGARRTPELPPVQALPRAAHASPSGEPEPPTKMENPTLSQK